MAAFSGVPQERRRAVRRPRPGRPALRGGDPRRVRLRGPRHRSRPIRRGSGRRSAPTAGCAATSRTAPAGSTRPATSSSTCPESHIEAVLEERSGGWLRCRVVAPRHEYQPQYTASPLLLAVDAATVGGTTTAVHGEDVVDELVGVSEGVPGQRFTLLRRPVVAAERPIQLEVAGDARLGAVAPGAGLRRERRRRPALAAQRDRRHDRVRAGRAPRRRLDQAVRARAAGRRPRPRPALPHRRRSARQHRRPRDRHAEVGAAVHRPRRQPAAGVPVASTARRWRRRRPAARWSSGRATAP